MARQYARRQRRERYLGALVVALGVLVLVVAIIALREPNGHVSSAGSPRTSASSVAKTSSSRHTKDPSHSTSSTPSTSDPASSANPKSVPLIVLNNSTVPHLAAQAAQRFESGGWTVTRYDNYQNDIISTCAYYDPASAGAKDAAQALRAQYPTIKRVVPKFSGLPDGPVVVILTRDYSAS